MVERCLYCAGPPGERIETREMMFGLRHSFTYGRCADCKSLWLTEVPSDLSVYYGDDYYSMTISDSGNIPAARHLTRTLLRLPSALTTSLAGKRGFPIYLKWFSGLNVTLSSRIADIGSGEGSLVIRMTKHGFEDIWGFDPFIKGDRDIGNGHIRRGSIQDAHGLFDVVMFNHSLEHVPRPLDALRQAKSHLTKEGSILVRIPLAGSYADREYGPNWMALDPPRHLNVPSRRGLEIAAKTLGLQITRVFFDSLPQQFWGSEQYAEDIPLFDERSGRGKPCDPRFKRRTRALNRREDGDQVGLLLKAIPKTALRSAQSHGDPGVQSAPSLVFDSKRS